ncbi:hypothetical protein [Aliivibrio fischeri]|uniref:hypothetical protein n=1 Tax=Aliivibrio fischeri TaxID=668 RepID=UPI0012D8C581|nr:hypothetical protein [Aliivibrio fischeri]MUK27217.1 hypothetical protein [Aliivibrio fischeri]MUK35889.1 hypothetical protein [Aliivibrio fischeri]
MPTFDQNIISLHELENYLRQLSHIKLIHIIKRCRVERILYVDDNIVYDSKEESIKLLAIEFYKNGYNLGKLKEKIEQLCHYYINDTYFDFIDNKDPISILFCYCHLLNNKVFSKNGNDLFFNTRRTLKDEPIEFIRHTTIQRKNTITQMRIDFISFINLITSDDSNKKKYINYLNEEYTLSRSKFDFNWLSKKDKEQAVWAIKYIKDNHAIKNNHKYIPNIIDDYNHYSIVIPALFHSLEISDDAKELFLIKMKKAWGQVKYRNKIKRDKKTTINLVIRQDSKSKLEDISHFYGLNLNETFEKLINNESKIIKNSGI